MFLRLIFPIATYPQKQITLLQFLFSAGHDGQTKYIELLSLQKFSSAYKETLTPGISFLRENFIESKINWIFREIWFNGF